MRVTIKEDEVKILKYPWIGLFKNEDNETVVLFESKNTGYCLGSNHENFLKNRFSEEWKEENFKPCSITLSSL